MVTPNKTWTSDPPTYFSSSTSFATQYREAAFFLKEAFVAAGHVVVRSTNGSTAPDATDQWTSAGVLVYGDAADPRAWVVLQSPVGSAGVGLFVYTLIGLNNPAVDTTPTEITLRGSTIAFSGGSTTTYPTAPNQRAHAQTTLVGWSVPSNSLWMAWRTADGDVIYGVKPAGVTHFTNMIVYRASGGFNDSGVGDLRVVWGFFFTSVDSDAVTWSTLGAGSMWMGCLADGTIPASNTVRCTGPMSALAFNQGRIDDGSVPNSLVYLYNDDVYYPRYYGVWLDVGGAPMDPPFAEIQADDIDPIRLITVGVLWLPTVASQIAGTPRIP